MTTLALAVDADDELWTLDNLPTPAAPYVEIGTELVEVRARFPSQTYSLTGQVLPAKIRVRRGVGGTTASSHLQNATLTPTYGLGGAGGGGAIAVTGTEGGEVVAATALLLPGTVTEPEAGQAAWDAPPGTQLLILNEAGDNPLAAVRLEGEAGPSGEGSVAIQANLEDSTQLADAVFDEAGVTLRAFNPSSQPSVRLEIVGGAEGSVNIPMGNLIVGIAGELEIRPDAGTIHMSTLPTSDPVSANQLWNDNGTLKISAGV